MGLLEKAAGLLAYDAARPILFSSGLFLFLFCGFLFLYKFMHNTVTLRIVYVTLFSLYFYYKTSGYYFLLLMGMSLSDYAIGFLLARTVGLNARRWLVALSVAIDIGILCYFKYTGFFAGMLNDLSGSQWMEPGNLFLPVGISFFTFQSISYTVDLYRGDIRPIRCWIDYLFYLSFFPQLVAGPIVRAKDFIPQIYQKHIHITREMFGTGIFLIVTGLFKKAVISDYISLNFVDRVFDNPLLYNGFENLMGVYGYALQIYCDFSGYSDMAIGLALLLGFRFNKNFDSPYKSATITEFWHRWHISLSTWLKDYLYIPLGGNRKGKVRTYLNLMITMLLGGLWHGASYRFICWGALHGTALSAHKFLMKRFPSMKPVGSEMTRGRRIVGIILTFNLVCFGWIFFRADSMATAATVLRQIFTDFHVASIPHFVQVYWPVFTVIALGYVLHFLPDRAEASAKRAVTAAPAWGQAALIALVIWGVMQIQSSEIQPFIYFQF